MRALCPGGQPARPGGGGPRRTALVTEPWQDLALVEVEEAVLLGAQLADADVRLSRAQRSADRAEMRARIGAAHDLRRDLLLGELRERGFEVRGQRQLRHERARRRGQGPDLARRLARPALVLGPADGELGIARLAAAAGALEAF